MQQIDKKEARRHSQDLSDKLKQTFKKYIAVNAQKPTVEGVTKEVMALCEDYYNKVGLPFYKHNKNILIPQKLRDDFLLEEKMAARISKDAAAVMDAMRNDLTLNQLSSLFRLNPFELIADPWNYQIDIKNMIRLSKDDLVAQFYISSLKESKEYKALNHYVKATYGEDKNLEDINIEDLSGKMGKWNDAFNKAINNYKKVEIATKICIQKAKVMSRELESNPEEKARYEKYLLSDAHKKHMQEFEKVRGISYVEYETLQLVALRSVVAFDIIIKDSILQFVRDMGKEDIDLKIKNEAAQIAHERTMEVVEGAGVSMLILAELALAPLIVTGVAFPPIFPIVVGVSVLAAVAIGIGGLIANEVMKDPEKDKTKATENTLKSISETNSVFNYNLAIIGNNASTVVDAMHAMESKQTKSASKGA